MGVEDGVSGSEDGVSGSEDWVKRSGGASVGSSLFLTVCRIFFLFVCGIFFLFVCGIFLFVCGILFVLICGILFVLIIFCLWDPLFICLCAPLCSCFCVGSSFSYLSVGSFFFSVRSFLYVCVFPNQSFRYFLRTNLSDPVLFCGILVCSSSSQLWTRSFSSDAVCCPQPSTCPGGHRHRAQGRRTLQGRSVSQSINQSISPPGHLAVIVTRGSVTRRLVQDNVIN